MNIWKEINKQEDHQTLKMEVEGGALYQNVITWKDESGKFNVAAAMCFAPNQTSVIEDSLEMVSSSLDEVAKKLDGVGIELYHHKK